MAVDASLSVKAPITLCWMTWPSRSSSSCRRTAAGPYATIGKAVGLSEAAVRQRVQRLLDSGVMQIVAVTDPLQLGFPRQAMIGLRTDGDLEAVADRLAELDEVDYVVITAGLVRPAHRGGLPQRRPPAGDPAAAARGRPGSLSTEAFVYLKLRKQTYTWGTA